MNRTIAALVCLTLLLAGASALSAQSFSSVVVLSEAAFPSADSTGFKAVEQADDPLAAATMDLENWRKSRAAMLRDDFGELARYREANAVEASRSRRKARRVHG
jgi:hypothetical protein